MLALPLGWSSCDQDTRTHDLPYEDEFEPVYPVPAVETLLAPANGTAIISGGDAVVFSWKEGELPEGSQMVVKYEVLFGPQGHDFTQMDEESNSVQTSDMQGGDPQLTLYGSFLDLIAEEAGIEPGATGTILWKVRGYCGLDQTLSTATGSIQVTRPAATTE